MRLVCYEETYSVYCTNNQTSLKDWKTCSLKRYFTKEEREELGTFPSDYHTVPDVQKHCPKNFMLEEILVKIGTLQKVTSDNFRGSRSLIKYWLEQSKASETSSNHKG